MDDDSIVVFPDQDNRKSSVPTFETSPGLGRSPTGLRTDCLLPHHSAQAAGAAKPRGT